MNLIALSRRAAEAEDLTHTPAIAICIAYPDGRLHNVHPMGGLRDVLHLRFSDCDGEGNWCFPEGKSPLVGIPMTQEQAAEVLDFVAKHPDVETIYAACYGGVSRSRGILAGLAAIHGWDDSELYAKGQPNAWCKTLMIREHTRRTTE